MKKILFLTGMSDRDKWFHAIAQSLKRQGKYEDHYITEVSANEAYLKKKGVPAERMYRINPPAKISKKPDIKYLRAKEQEYGMKIWDAVELARARGIMANATKKEILARTQQVFEQAEAVMKRVKPDYLICYGVAGYKARIIFEVAKKHSKPLELRPAEITDKFCLIDNLEDRWKSLEKNYKQLSTKDYKPSIKQQATDYYKSFNNKPRLAQSQFKTPRGKLVKDAFKKMHTAIFVEKRVPKDISIYRQRAKAKYVLMRGYFQRPDYNEKIIYYPLQVDPEVSTLIYGKWFVDQLNLIKLISKSIPVNYTLYVKEHRHEFCNRKTSFYKEIKNIPNTRLLSPYEDNFKILKKSDLVITNTGTTGFEALLFGKPAIILGNTFYNVSEQITKLKIINDLPATIDKSLQKIVDKKKVIKLLYCMYLSSYEGFARLPVDCVNESLKPENINNLGKGIHEYISNQ